MSQARARTPRRSVLAAGLICAAAALGACDDAKPPKPDATQTPPTPAQPAPPTPSPDANATPPANTGPTNAEATTPPMIEASALAGVWRLDRPLVLDAILDQMRRSNPRRWELVQRERPHMNAVKFGADAIWTELTLDPAGTFELFYTVPMPGYGPAAPELLREVTEAGRWSVDAGELTMLTMARDGEMLATPVGLVSRIEVEGSGQGATPSRLWVDIRQGEPPLPALPLVR